MKTHPLQTWREAKKISQIEAALILDSTQGAISHIETGRNDISKETARKWHNRTNGELPYSDLLLFEWSDKAA